MEFTLPPHGDRVALEGFLHEHTVGYSEEAGGSEKRLVYLFHQAYLFVELADVVFNPILHTQEFGVGLGAAYASRKYGQLLWRWRVAFFPL